MVDLEYLNMSDILLQEGSVRLIDSLISMTPTSTQTRYRVSPDCLFLDDFHLERTALMENMIQTCLARRGYINRFMLNVPLEASPIEGVRDFVVYSDARVGEVLDTTIEVHERIRGTVFIAANIVCGDRDVASCTIRMNQGHDRFYNGKIRTDSTKA
jgi:predicted hotdog family 3-hydroxylacyl-ACP dehydratase